MATVTDLCFLPARELARMIREREVSAAEVMEAHLTRIEQVNPSLNAIGTLVADEARHAAGQADTLLSSGGQLGPLHGLPVAHKDLVPTKGIRTTFGSPIFADFVPNDRDPCPLTPGWRPSSRLNGWSSRRWAVWSKMRRRI